MAETLESTNGQQPFALVGYVDTPADIYHACEALRDAGYKHFDAHTPFPVHGLEKAMGLPASKLPWVVLAGGFTGLSGAVALAYYTQEIAYKHVIGGKEAFSYQAFIPIFFELTVLFSAFATFFGLWAMNRQPEYFHPVMQHPSFTRATDDKFFVSVEAKDPKFDRQATKELLAKLGFHEIEEVAP
jgi:hypothetical protein